MRTYKIDEIRSIISARDLHRPLDVALVGATGVGKSSAINALFGSEVAKVGNGVDPETMNTAEYSVSDIFRIHDSAGFGDGLEADKVHARNLSKLLLKTFSNNVYGYIDLSLVILDGASRDLGTSYQLLEQIVLKCMNPKRIIVAINQADMAMSGRNWDKERNQPNDLLKKFLDEKALSVKARIKEATNLDIKTPVYFSALKKYNLDKVMDAIISQMPNSRREMQNEY